MGPRPTMWTGLLGCHLDVGVNPPVQVRDFLLNLVLSVVRTWSSVLPIEHRLTSGGQPVMTVRCRPYCPGQFRKRPPSAPGTKPLQLAIASYAMNVTKTLYSLMS